MRLNVIKGVAKALSYMHHDCSPPIIHRDISSNNVLLDSEYEAHVSDFGTARLLKSDSSNWTSFAGTFDYTATGTIFLVSCFPSKLPLYIIYIKKFNCLAEQSMIKSSL